MAGVGSLIASTHEAYLPMVADQVLTGLPTLEHMLAMDKVKYKGGRDIVEPILKALPAGGRYTGLEQLSAPDNDELDAAIYGWRQYHAFPAISGIDVAKNSGEAEVISIWRTKMEAAGMKIASDLATDIFAVQNTGDPAGVTPLEEIVDDGNTYTVGGLTSDDVANWQGNVLSNSNSSLTLDDLESVYQACTPGGGGIEPTDIASTNVGYVSVWKLVQANQRFLERNAKVGFKNFMFDNATFYKDNSISTLSTAAGGGTYGGTSGNRMFFLNHNFLRLNILEGGNFALEDKTPPLQDGYMALIKLYCQLSCNARRFQGVYYDFAAA